MKKNYILSLPQNKITLSVFVFVFTLLCSVAGISQTWTLTNASATGMNGPTQLQTNAAYLSTNLNGSITVSGNGIQQFTVPASGGYRIEAYGAQGGVSWGQGAYIAGDFTLTGGQVLSIAVGQAGGSGNSSHGSGGGGSFVATGTVPLVVAGGGGGRGASSTNILSTSLGTTSTAGQSPSTNQAPGGTGGGGGGAGSATAGGTSVTPGGNSSGSDWASGGGGFYTNGGACNAGNTPGGRAFLNGAQGGNASTSGGVTAGGFGGGGGNGDRGAGGGGYSGGGAGTNNTDGGGGGGSFNGGVNQTNTSGVNAGHGRVLITRLCNISLTSSGNNSLTPYICSGGSVSLTTNAISGYSWSTGNTTSSVIVVSPTITTSYSVIGTSSANCSTAAFITVTVSGSSPVLAVTSSTNALCLGRTATLTASGALSYTWSNNVTNGVSFTPSVTTTYTVFGQNGCGTTSAVASITVAPLPVSTIATPSIACATRPVTLTATSAVTGHTWQPSGLSGASVVVGPSVTTIYTVTASDGTCSGTATLNLLVNPIPTVNIVSTSSNVCQGAAVTMTASGGLSYVWNPGNLTGTVITVNPTGPTLYSVVATNTFNCTNGANQVVLTQSSPTLVVSASDNLICGGSSATLTVTGANTYTWLNNNSNVNVITVSPASTTIYSVTGISTGIACDRTETIQIAVFNPSTAISGPTAICNGGTATLTASGADTYQWDNGAPVPIIAVNPIATTVYTVSALTATGNINCASTATIQVVVNPNPTVTVVPTRTFMCIKESNTLTASGAGSYSWNTTETTAAIVVSSTIATTINYTVTGTDATGCKNVKVYQLKINGCTGVNELSYNTNLLRIYPNPNNGNFVLESVSDVELRITNELGQLIQMVTLNGSNNHQSTVQGLAAGIYFVNGKNVNSKIVVEK